VFGFNYKIEGVLQEMRFRFFKKQSFFLLIALSFCQNVSAEINLSLDNSVALALQNDPFLQAVEAQKEQAVWGVKEAKSSKGISLDYQHTDMRSTAPHTWQATMAAVSPYNYYSNTISASIPLYTGGRLENTIDQAKLSLNASELEIDATKQKLKLETDSKYYEALKAKTVLDIAHQMVDNFNQHLNNVQQMYNAGVVPWHDVVQTKVRMANAENNLVKAQSDYDLSIRSLNKTIGLSLDADIKLIDVLEYQKYDLNLDEMTAAGLENRPEMAQQEIAVKIQEKQMNIAKSAQRPDVRIKGTMAWDDDEFAGTDNRDWTAMLTVNQNIFDSGNTDAKIKAAKSGILSAHNIQQQTRNNIALEISDACLNMRKAEKRITTNKVAIEEANVNLDISQKSYGAGVDTNLDVMDAELALDQAKTNYIDSLYDYNISKAKLDRAVGKRVEIRE